MVGTSTIYVVLAAICWGLSGGIGSILISDGWGTFMVAFYRGAIGLLFVLAWLAFRPSGSGLTSRRLWFWSAMAGLGVAGNFVFYFVSIEQGSVAVAATLMYCAPIFVYLMSFALKLERPTTLKWAAIAMVILGIVLLTEIYDVGASSITPIGVGTGLLAGLSYAIFIFAFKSAVSHGSPQAILTIAFTVLTTILIWPSDINQVVSVLNTSDWPLFVALGVCGAGLSFVLYILGLNRIAPAAASIVAMIEPVTALLFGVVILSERLVGLQIFGMGLILVTVTALSVSSSIQRSSS
jgi:drug/metabolite transporter (DMT)-like permease